MKAAEKMPAEKKPSMMMHSMAMPDTTPSKIVVRSLADFLWGVDDHDGQSKYPSFGLTLDEKGETGYLVKRVIPESLADEKGLQKDDILLTVDGLNFATKNELRKYLGTKNWDDTIRFELVRE